MSTRWARVARGTVAACFAVFVGALFHVAAGGGAPAALAVVLSLAFSVPLCVLLAGRRVALWRQSISVAASQLVFHALFGLGASSTAISGASGHVHATSQLTVGTAAPLGHVHSLLPDSPYMWIGHASAAIVTIVALRHGEAAFWGFARIASIGVVGIIAFLHVVPVTVRRFPLVEADATPAWTVLPNVTLGSLRHRGPPAALAF
jgi:hypothetical protein